MGKQHFRNSAASILAIATMQFDTCRPRCFCIGAASVDDRQIDGPWRSIALVSIDTRLNRDRMRGKCADHTTRASKQWLSPNIPTGTASTTTLKIGYSVSASMAKQKRFPTASALAS